MAQPRAAELALIEREAAWNHAHAQPVLPPGTDAEERALAAIDARREQDREQLFDTLQDRRRRALRYWGRGDVRHG